MSPLDHAHDDVQAALAAEALGILEEGPERDALLAHVAGCPECAATVAELREGAAALALLAPPRALEAGRARRMRSRLVARAAADHSQGDGLASGGVATAIPLALADVEVPAPVRPTLPPLDREAPGVLSIERPRGTRGTGREARGGSRAGWLAAAASVVLLLGLGAWAMSLQGRLARAGQAMAQLEQERADLREALVQRDRTLDELTALQTRVIDLAAAGPRAPSGRMFWNTSTNAWTFFAHDLPAIPEGREYQLWIVTPDQKIPGGTFRPDARGQAAHQATYQVPREQVRAVAVTLEPAGGVPVATGPIVLVGALPATE